MWLWLALLEPLLVLTAMGAPNSTADDAGRAAPFLVGVGESSLRCVGALVSVRGVLTTRECGAVALTVRAAGGSAVAVRAVRAPRAGDVALLELVESVAGGRPILLAEERTQCDTSCYVARERRPSVVAATPATCGGADAGCVRAEGLCGAEAGGAVVCGGRLCGVLARTDTDCPELHRFYSVPNWKQFLHCAHTLNTCDSEECAEVCEETAAGAAGMGAELSGGAGGQPPGKYQSGREYRAVAAADVKEERAVEERVVEERVVEERGAEGEEREREREREQERERSAVREEQPVVVVEDEPEVPSVRAEPSPAAARAARGMVFEPGRADFRSGEYGDPAVEYEDVESRGAPPGPSSAASSDPSSSNPSSSDPPPFSTFPPTTIATLAMERRAAAEEPEAMPIENLHSTNILRSYSLKSEYNKTFLITLLFIKMIFM